MDQGYECVDEDRPYVEKVIELYREDYAADYPSLYTTPWGRKHEINARNLNRILESFSGRRPKWLDLACGQAWHFAQFPGRASMLGVDLSQPQLIRAQKNAPHASFIRGDMSRMVFDDGEFDLVTNFWAGYCYLASNDLIGVLLKKAVRLLRTGGCLYFEVLLPRDLESFNRSKFSGHTGFLVSSNSSDYAEWVYDDSGGRHAMLSPPIEFFLDLLSPSFEQMEAEHDSAFMVHLIASGKRASEPEKCCIPSNIPIEQGYGFRGTEKAPN